MKIGPVGTNSDGQYVIKGYPEAFRGVMDILQPILPPGTPGGLAAEQGTAVHRLIANNLRYDMRDGRARARMADPALDGYMKAAESFLELQGLIPDAVEDPRLGLCPYFAEVVYGGTPDLVARDAKGGEVIVEWKTSAPAAWHTVQLEAYSWLTGFERAAIGYTHDHGMPEVRRITVYLHAGGTFAHTEELGACYEQRRAWEGCLRVARWREIAQDLPWLPQ